MRNHRPLREQPRVEPLEARILYSADPASAVFDAMGAGAPVVERRAIDAPPPQTPVVGVADGAATEKRQELVLVDTRVSNWQQLVDDMPRGADRNVEIVLLDAARDGIEQISERLAQERGLDAVHIVSHGEAGALQIGATRLNFDTLLADATAVSRWRLALNGGADLMLYGCDLAASGDGRALVDALSRLTGADVAASIDVTGGTAAGGDWVLEYAAGDIQASALADAPGLESWAGSLQFALMGDETRANQSTSGTQGTHPTVRQVAIDAEGNFVVIWNDTVNSGDVLGCRFDASGNVLGSGQFTVNSTTPSSQGRATVAMNASGAFVVAWESAGQENGLGVYAQRFDANGLKQGGEIHVNQWTTNDQGKPSVAIDSAGNFIITWTSDGQDGSGYGVYARRFDAAGNAMGDGNEFVVNSTTPNDQQHSSVALNDNGDFVIVWEGQDDGGLGILGQRFNGAGVAQGGEFHVNATPAGTQDYPSVAMTADGDFVVAWSSEGQDSSGWGAYAQRFNAAGVAQGDEIRVAETTSDDQDYPVVAMDSRGNFLVTWESYGQPGGSGWDVYGRLYDRSGNAMPEGELRINTTTSGTQDFPSVAWNGTQAVYVWAGNGTGDPAGIFFQRVNAAVAGATMSAISGNTTEATGSASFSITLNSQPTADVTISIASSDTTEGTVSTASLTFTAANWNVAQVVTVTGVNDAIDDGDVTYSIVTGDAVSSDANYDGLALADVSVTNADNDTAGVSVSAISGNTTEAGGTASFNVVLDTQPTADVTISITSSNTAEGIVSTSLLTFDSSNWNTAQTVTVTGVNDWIVDGNVPYMITTDPAQSDDSQYAGIDAADVSVTNMDNDTAGITVASSPGLTTTEAGGTASFGIVLGSEPTADVTISISTGNAAEGSVSVSSLTFTATNWNTAQFVTVTGVDDDVVDGNIAYAVVTGLATSDDTNYGGMAVNDVALANLDDERAPILTLPSVLQVDEDAPLRLGDAGVSVTDVNGDLARIDVAVAHGLLEVNLSGGASLVAASADHRSIGLTGTQAQLVDALARISYRSDADWSGTDALDISATDASGLQASSLVAIQVSPVNDAPVITSAGHVRIAEGQLLATRVISTDVEGDTRHYAIVGGADAAQFVIDNASGELRLRSAPDAEAPADADRDNVYELTVEADDRQGGTTRQNLEVSVTGVNEAPSVLVTGLSVPTGGAVTLSQHQIIGRDVDSPAGSLVYSVSGVVNGRFELANQPGVAITSFSESALESGLVTLVHDAGTPPPQFVMIVSDGQASSAPLLVHAIVTSGEPAPGQHGGVDTAPLPEERAGPAPAATEAAPAVAESAQPSRVEAPNPPRPSSQISAPADAARLADSTPRATFTLQVPAATGRGEGLDIPWSREDPHKALLLALGYDADSRTSKELEGSDEPRLGPASDQDSNPAHLELGDVVLQTLGIALTAGSVWWALRATGLVTALLASLPAWRQFDFLPVLADDEDEDTPDWSPAEDAEAARDEAAVGRDLFVEGVLR